MLALGEGCLLTGLQRPATPSLLSGLPRSPPAHVAHLTPALESAILPRSPFRREQHLKTGKVARSPYLLHHGLLQSLERSEGHKLLSATRAISRFSREAKDAKALEVPKFSLQRTSSCPPPRQKSTSTSHRLRVSPSPSLPPKPSLSPRKPPAVLGSSPFPDKLQVPSTPASFS